MPELFGTHYSRAELLRRVGRLEQAAGVRLVTLGDGQGRGVRVLEFRTGTGFAFDVVVDRSFDVGRCEMGGRPLSWLSAAGVVAPWYYEPDGWGWFRSWGGGMVVTCGLDHTLGPGEDSAEQFNQPHILKTVPYGLHGRVGGLPARLAGYGERWDGDECVLWAEGEVLQSAVFGEQLELRRRIEARVGESRFTIHDVVANAGHTRASHMFLYHCNAGFPVVDSSSELLVPSRRTTTDYGVPVEGYATMSAPVRGATEACFEHDLIAEPEGTVPVALVNRALALGVYQVFRATQLPFHTVWRMMGEGTYALGMEPSTNRDAGRWDARERGELQWLEPGEERRYDLEIGALDGEAAIGEFEGRVSRLAAATRASERS
ncbi:MAG TPA: aldose 1-epimerase family protein [Streptosporangiaceae bacterium]|nr:aldose 1-epimerase family protein [Streptosporangiaceae bacterium]